ncbi:primosomal replication protein N [Psychrobium sp. 1_MG-2023]|uniref:primosomal replication protein N n=1 Tax=Psychrobium sp. 1_MG-2023 TaxID=3062624 RepID=UPI000C343495|nr:primosomal replication protein N [Psychrobium sp. 1_MG-2023]MDP2561294.1 primosomal replication protein N [Psychrobium sp. 1_MG-2023]PKF54110.1 primosomal replication protein N [Alteromonadales bacterium alter-6D02]
MTENSTVISGTLCSSPRKKVSPAGIPHTYIVMDHRSQQIEAGFPRGIYCRMTVVISGQDMQVTAEKLVKGSNIKASGYLVWHQGRNSSPKIVLHAHSIELMN